MERDTQTSPTAADEIYDARRLGLPFMWLVYSDIDLFFSAERKLSEVDRQFLARTQHGSADAMSLEEQMIAYVRVYFFYIFLLTCCIQIPAAMR